MNSTDWLKWFSQAAGGTVVLMGSLVLAGWAGDNPLLKSLAPGLTAMNPLTAMAFQLVGCALLLLKAEHPGSWRRRLGVLCAGLVVALATMRLAGYLLHWDIALDRLLFTSQLDQEPIPNRMAPNTALCFLLGGAGILLLDRVTRGHRWPAQIMFLAVGVISFTVILGYIYSATIFTRVAYIPMALNTALGFMLLAVGGLGARPQRGLMTLVTSAETGGMIVRRLVPAAILIPPTIGFIHLLGERWGLYGTEFGLALFVLSNVTIFLGLIWWSASAIQRLNMMRQRADALERENIRLETETTERKRAEQLKVELLQVLSHELRTPVTIIQEAVSLVSDGAYGATTPDQRDCLNTVEETTTRLTALFDKIVLATEMMTGQLELKAEAVDIAVLLDQVEERLRPYAEQYGVTLQSIRNGSVLLYQADRRLLTEAFVQLSLNAIQASPKQGRVTLSCAVTPDAIVVIVEDQGEGIPAAQLDDLFQRFRWTGGIDDRKTGGMGLGLFIAKTAIATHGGAIIAESRREAGTRMTIRLPVTKQVSLRATHNE